MVKVIESKAGEGANFPDSEFSEAGAKIVYDTKEIYQADVILKVEPPTIEEIEMMKGRQTQSQLYNNSLKKIH